MEKRWSLIILLRNKWWINLRFKYCVIKYDKNFFYRLYTRIRPMKQMRVLHCSPSLTRLIPYWWFYMGLYLKWKKKNQTLQMQDPDNASNVVLFAWIVGIWSKWNTTVIVLIGTRNKHVYTVKRVRNTTVTSERIECIFGKQIQFEWISSKLKMGDSTFAQLEGCYLLHLLYHSIANKITFSCILIK